MCPPPQKKKVTDYANAVCTFCLSKIYNMKFTIYSLHYFLFKMMRMKIYFRINNFCLLLHYFFFVTGASLHAFKIIIFPCSYKYIYNMGTYINTEKTAKKHF